MKEEPDKINTRIAQDKIPRLLKVDSERKPKTDDEGTEGRRRLAAGENRKQKLRTEAAREWGGDLPSTSRDDN